MSLFEEHYQPVMTFAEIGEEMGISHQRVEKLYARALDKIRRSDGLLAGARDLVAVIDARREYASERGGRRVSV